MVWGHDYAHETDQPAHRDGGGGAKGGGDYDNQSHPLGPHPEARSLLVAHCQASAITVRWSTGPYTKEVEDAARTVRRQVNRRRLWSRPPTTEKKSGTN